MFKIFIKYLLLIVLVIIAPCAASAEYPIERSMPLSRDKGVNANFGQFRSRYGTYKAHDGIDFKASIGTQVFPVSSGTAHIFPDDNPGWGRYVKVEING